MKYRSEIDGLRAIAVVPVILFHAGFEIFSGGFVGVDVFFVISGYLITTIIINEMDEAKFSLLNFYERRARRILPALFFVVLCCLPFAWFLLMPSDMKDFSQSLVAVATFSSNILFWRESGYFDTAAELKPLLHTWSLAVEEQFYILFPLFLMAAWRFGKRAIVWTLVAAFVISLATAQWGAYNKPAATFYLLPTRAWELLIGSFAAFYLQKRSVTAPLWVSNALSAAGLIAVLYGVFAFDEATPFPSVYALAPTVGTVLIILFAMRGTAVHALLSLKAFVGVGLISYSLYLWHQPVFAFWRHYNVFEPTHLQMVMLSLLCLPLAYLTYRFVEAPFRRQNRPIKRLQVLSFSMLFLMSFSVFGVTGHLLKGFPFRFSGNVLSIAQSSIDRTDQTCISSSTVPVHPVAGCNNGETQVSVMLIGDSHANAIRDVFLNALEDAGIGAYATSYSGCLPLRGFYRVDRGNEHLCSEFNLSALEYAAQQNIETLVLVSRFPLYLWGERFDNGERGVEEGEAAYVELVGLPPSDWLDESRRTRVLSEYRRQILELAENFNVILVSPIPEAGWNVPALGARLASREEEKLTLVTNYERYLMRTAPLLDLFQELDGQHDNVIFSPVHLDLCSDGLCYNILNDVVYYYDDDHLTNEGAEIVVPTILESIRQVRQLR